MAFEVILKGASKIVPSEGAANGIVTQLQNLFGEKTVIEVNEIADTFDGDGNKVGSIVRRKSEYPEKPITP